MPKMLLRMGSPLPKMLLPMSPPLRTTPTAASIQLDASCPASQEGFWGAVGPQDQAPCKSIRRSEGHRRWNAVCPLPRWGIGARRSQRRLNKI